MQPHSPPPSTRRRLRDAENLVALASDLALRRTVWESRPSVLEYAVTSACNLRCPMCAQSDPARRVQTTPREQRARLFAELFPGATILKPFSLSEPLLNDLEELVPYFAEHDVRLDVVTNACLLDARRLELLLPHLHRVTFSVDSHRKEIFEKVRPPAVFEEVDANIRRAMPRLDRAGVLTRINMVLVRDALAHLEDFVDYVVDQYGCRYLDVLELVPYTPGATELDPFVEPGAEEVGRALERMLARAEARRLNIDLIVRHPYAQCRIFDPPMVPGTAAGVFEAAHQRLRKHHAGFCEQAMMYLKVNPDGDSYPCCKAPPELRLGNVIRDGLEGVWNSKVAQELRKRMFAGDYPRPCRECLFFRFSRATANAPEPSLFARAVRFPLAAAVRGVRGGAAWVRVNVPLGARRGAHWARWTALRTRERVRRLCRALRLPKILPF